MRHLAALHFMTSSTILVGLRPGLAWREVHLRCKHTTILPHHSITSSPYLVGLRPDVSVPWNPSLGPRRFDFGIPGDSFSVPEGLLGLPRAAPEAPNRPQKGSPGRPGDPLKTGRPMVVRLHKPTGTILVACASKSDPPRPGTGYQSSYPACPQMK